MFHNKQYTKNAVLAALQLARLEEETAISKPIDILNTLLYMTY